MTLRSGEIHTGDGIIGADGASGVVRRKLMEEEDADLESDVPTGLAMYGCVWLVLQILSVVKTINQRGRTQETCCSA